MRIPICQDADGYWITICKLGVEGKIFDSYECFRHTEFITVNCTDSCDSLTACTENYGEEKLWTNNLIFSLLLRFIGNPCQWTKISLKWFSKVITNIVGIDIDQSIIYSFSTSQILVVELIFL